MLKKYFIPSSLVLLLLLSSFIAKENNASYNHKTEINFFKGTWKDALIKAKAEKKIIFLDIGASWCGPCKKLKNKTFANAKVAAYFNTNFINVILDGEDGADGTMLAEKYNLAYYPSLFFIDSTGNVLKAGSGYYNSREILQFAKSVSK